MLVENYIDDEIPVLKTTDTIRTAVKKMDEANLNQLPIVDQEIFQGILLRSTARTVYDTKSTLEGIQVEGRKLEITATTHVLEALKVASEAHLNIIGVVEKESNKYLGAVKKEGMLGYFAQMYGLRASGSILTLNVLERDYSLNEISRIVESNGAKILSVFTDVLDDEPYNMLVTLKINLADLSRVIVALQRHNYNIAYSFHEEEYKSKDQERLEQLLRFLEI